MNRATQIMVLLTGLSLGLAARAEDRRAVPEYKRRTPSRVYRHRAPELRYRRGAHSQDPVVTLGIHAAVGGHSSSRGHSRSSFGGHSRSSFGGHSAYRGYSSYRGHGSYGGYSGYRSSPYRSYGRSSRSYRGYGGYSGYRSYGRRSYGYGGYSGYGYCR